MFDFWSVGMFGAFALIAALISRLAIASNRRDTRREQCVSRLLTDQLGPEQG